MKRLLTFKQSIATLEDLGVDYDDEDDDDEDLDLDDEDLDLDDDDLGLAGRIRGITAEELQSLLADMEQVTSMSRPRKSAQPVAEKPKKKAKAAASEALPKKKRKTASDKAQLPVFDLEEPEFPARPKAPSRAASSVDTDAYGEPVALHAADVQDKAARKKSLRFHTAKIESASARREHARVAAGGDDDIPWKERKKEREKREKRELGKTRGLGGADLDEEEPEPRAESSRKRRRDEEDSGGDDDAEGYYDLVKRKSMDKKDKKKAEYEATVAMAKYVSLLSD